MRKVVAFDDAVRPHDRMPVPLTSRLVSCMSPVYSATFSPSGASEPPNLRVSSAASAYGETAATCTQRRIKGAAVGGWGPVTFIGAT